MASRPLYQSIMGMRCGTPDYMGHVGTGWNGEPGRTGAGEFLGGE